MISKRGLDLIKKWEKLSRVAFKPVPGDPWTLGWGRTRGVKEHDTCSADDAEKWILEDVSEAEAVAKSCITAKLNQNQWDAVISFAYNVGNGRAGPDGKDGLCHLKSGGQSHLLIYINMGKFELAADEFLKWDRAHGVELRGLKARREEERQLFLEKDKDHELVDITPRPSGKDSLGTLSQGSRNPNPFSE